LGNGEIKSVFQVEVKAISHSAKEKIEAAGGSIKLI
jgi:ribosomal protein L15